MLGSLSGKGSARRWLGVLCGVLLLARVAPAHAEDPPAPTPPQRCLVRVVAEAPSAAEAIQRGVETALVSLDPPRIPVVRQGAAALQLEALRKEAAAAKAHSALQLSLGDVAGRAVLLVQRLRRDSKVFVERSVALAAEPSEADLQAASQRLARTLELEDGASHSASSRGDEPREQASKAEPWWGKAWVWGLIAVVAAVGIVVAVEAQSSDGTSGEPARSVEIIAPDPTSIESGMGSRMP